MCFRMTFFFLQTDFLLSFDGDEVGELVNSAYMARQAGCRGEARSISSGSRHSP